MVIEWKKGKEGGGQEGVTGESDKGREIVYGPEESIKECKTGEKGQKGDREKRSEKRRREKGEKEAGEMWRRKTYPMSAFHVNNFEKVHNSTFYLSVQL